MFQNRFVSPSYPNYYCFCRQRKNRPNLSLWIIINRCWNKKNAAQAWCWQFTPFFPPCSSLTTVKRALFALSFFYFTWGKIKDVYDCHLWSNASRLFVFTYSCSQMMTHLRNLCIFLMKMLNPILMAAKIKRLYLSTIRMTCFRCSTCQCAVFFCRLLESTKRQPAPSASLWTPGAATDPQNLFRPTCSAWRSTAPNSSCSPERHLHLRRETAL